MLVLIKLFSAFRMKTAVVIFFEIFINLTLLIFLQLIFLVTILLLPFKYDIEVK
ncbi:hypothetical protein P344_03260 [Spiroplasma mirum ATCC 29335]|uniref:Uncharacterized protein n=1 Tax=Spiroplasma mirum ATCC 29335 TaxID=838561 RepID=W6AMP5_9MOLU|nr:hypothetical protein P344_03260 [Spiroplasma mirum ATCC 29335]AKM53079.1 hypothetical protein SATRI_v1c06050 [Spiroplasma atrichopogonis]